MVLFASTTLRSLLLIAVSGLVLTGCGGGGGGSGGGGGGPAPGLTMALSATSMTFAATNGGSPASQNVMATFTGTASGTLYLLISPADPTLVAVGNILVTGTNSGQATVTPQPPSSVAAGSHATTITVVACLNDPTCKTNQVTGSPQTINITYTVAGVASSASSLSYTIGNAPVAADYTQTFSVSGYPTQTWTSQITGAPWLSFAPSTGSTAAAVSVQAALDQAQINALDNGTYNASVALSTPTGIGVTLPVTLTVAKTKVAFVAPYVATSGTTDNVIIRGEHFGLITPTEVNFGSHAASAFTVISDTEIHASYPALPAGSYPVQLLVNGTAVGSSRAVLVVVDAPNFPATTFGYAGAGVGGIYGLVYDAERKALIARVQYTGSAAYQLERYAFGNAAWGTPTVAPLKFWSAFALSIDGTQLISSYYDSTIGIYGNGEVAPLDPVSLTASGPVVGSPNATGYGIPALAVANNGVAIMQTTHVTLSSTDLVLAYSQLHGTLDALPNGSLVPPQSAVIGASADGALVYIVSGQPNAVPSGPPVWRYDTTTGALVRIGSSVQSATIALDRHGSRVLLNANDVYDGSLTLLGSLPSTTLASILSPDGRRAYSYDSNGTVRVYDLTATPIAGLFPESLPAKTLTGSPVAATSAALAVSPDGGSLFVATISGIYVVPMP